MAEIEWEYDEPGEQFMVVDVDDPAYLAREEARKSPPIHSVPGSDPDTPLRYDPDKIMNPPYGVVLQVGDLPRAPRVEALSGARQAQALMLAQFPLDPLRLSARKPSPSTKLNAAQRRAAKIAAGRLKVTADGRLSG
jgi:hypothetical protein